MDEKKLEDRLILSTKKSLYDPIEIVIDDQAYQSLKTTKAVLAKIDELDKLVDKENVDALYKIVQLMFDVPMAVLEELDKREVENIYIFVKRKFVEIEKERLKLVTASFGSAWVKKDQVKKAIPKNRKRPGSKQ